MNKNDELIIKDYTSSIIQDEYIPTLSEVVANLSAYLLTHPEHADMPVVLNAGDVVNKAGGGCCAGWYDNGEVFVDEDSLEEWADDGDDIEEQNVNSVCIF